MKNDFIFTVYLAFLIKWLWGMFNMVCRNPPRVVFLCDLCSKKSFVRNCSFCCLVLKSKVNIIKISDIFKLPRTKR